MRDERADWRPPGSEASSTAHASAGLTASRNLTDIIELMFFAYRDFTGEADAHLADRGFGRAHHRVIYFVSRHPGLAVTDLLAILKITKQSLARVLKQLVSEGYISQRSGDADKRQRLLYPTERGAELSQTLTHLQMTRIAGALQTLSDADRDGVRNFLFAMVSAEDQASVAALMARDLRQGDCDPRAD